MNVANVIQIPRAALEVEPEVGSEVILDLGKQQPLIPEGAYLARFTHHETAIVFGTGKVFLWFTLADGAHVNTRLYRAYRARKLLSKPGRGGKFLLAKRSDLLMMLVRLEDMKVRPDRISLLCLKHCVLKLKIRTVTTDHKQRPLPEWLRYSVVDDVLSKETGLP